MVPPPAGVEVAEENCELLLGSLLLLPQVLFQGRLGEVVGEEQFVPLVLGLLVVVVQDESNLFH